MPDRFATIDIGTNTVLLLVVEPRGDRFEAIAERAEITRLGRGVDRSGELGAEGIADTVAALERYADEARRLGVERFACVATSAARDARNGAAFFEAVRSRCGLEVEVIEGEEEARLVYLSARRDFGPGPLAVLDIGGGSTELCFGDGEAPKSRRSIQIGAVRLTERHTPADPPTRSELRRMMTEAREAVSAFQGMEAVGAGNSVKLIGVAGTVTTLSAVLQKLERYDGTKVHGSQMTSADIEGLVAQLAELPLAERAKLPGMVPKRADVIVAGAIVLLEAMRATGFHSLTVSDRGVRWGLVYDRAR